MRHDVTPVGLHYLLVHFDIPALHPEEWRLQITGAVERELVLDLEEIRHRPAKTVTVTMECAGNGRARLEPRPISQPWLNEAIGTARWTGAPLGELLDEVGIGDAVELVFTGADHGIEGGEELDYARSLPAGEARRPSVLLAYEMNGRPLEPQHGYPLRLLVPGWYGMTSVKWLTRIEAVTEPFRGFHQATAYHYKQSDEEPGEPVTRIRPRALMIPPGFPDFPSGAATSIAAPSPSRDGPGAGWRRSSASRSASTASGTRRSWTSRSASGHGAAGHGRGMPNRASTCSAAARPTPAANRSLSNSPGTCRGSATISFSRSRWPSAEILQRPVSVPRSATRRERNISALWVPFRCAHRSPGLPASRTG